MGTIVTIDEAQANLAGLIRELTPGKEIIITENDRPVAKLVSQPTGTERRQPGRCAGMIVLLTEDNEHLEGFGSSQTPRD